MTRADLTTKLSLRMNISKREAERYLTCILDAIMDNLKGDGRVVVQGFGSFKLKEYKARLSKKPITGEPIQLPVRRKAVFHVGKELREDINKDSEAERVRESTALRLKRLRGSFETVHGISEPVLAAK